MKFLTSFVCLCLSLSCVFGQNVAYLNGNWFNGKGFTKGNYYAVKGILTKKAPSEINRTIDLAEQFVLPCFADVNSRILSTSDMPGTIMENYFKEGVYYLQVVGNSKAERLKAEQAWQRPIHPDVRFANGALTCTHGLPFFWEESQAMGVRFVQIEQEKERVKKSRTMEGDSYWFFDSKMDVDKKWAAFMEQKPDVAVLYLLDVKNNGGKEGFGLDEATAKALASKAKKDKVRLIAKVQTPADVDFAIKLKVKGLLNIPGNDWNGMGSSAVNDLRPKTINKLAKKDIFVCPNVRKGRDAAMQKTLLDGKDAQKNLVENTLNFHRATLQKLQKAGVLLAMGSDDMINTSQMELNYWTDLDVFTPADLITILSKNSAQAIFPDRPVGELKEGSEANFMVLPDDPIKELIKLRKRSYYVRNGKIVEGF